MFSNAKVNENGGTPDWEHTLGQGSPLYLLKEDDCSNIINGLAYNLKNIEEFNYGSGGDNYEVQMVSIFENVKIKIFDSTDDKLEQHTLSNPFIIILVKQTQGTHRGRRLLKMGKGFTYSQTKNSDFYDEINSIIPNPWFGYKLEYDNLITGNLTLTIIKAPISNPVVSDSAIRYTTKTERASIWDRLIELYKNKLEDSNSYNYFGVNKIYYGSPGTGKSYKVDNIINCLESKYFERLTFHPEFDNSSFVGGYKPISEEDSEGNDIIKYKFIPQAFTNIYKRAWEDSDNQYYLVIEEINRGNCAEIFGEIFQLLDRNSNYTVSPSKELKDYLISNEGFNDSSHQGIINGLKLPSNLSILATMNTSDQSLFPMDSAFKRRWEWEYVPICYTQIDDEGKPNRSFDFIIDIQNGKKYSWIKFIEQINLKHIKINPALGMDKCIGNYFIKPDNELTISLKPFINKVIFYLWNDVFKDEENSVFEDNTSYEDFFPIENKGKSKIEELFNRIELKPIAKEYTLDNESQIIQNAAEGPVQYGDEVS